MATKTTSARAAAPKKAAATTVRLLPILHGWHVDMVERAVLNGATVDGVLLNAISRLEPEITMTGASILTVTLLDTDGDLLRSPILNGRIDLDLTASDGGRWRMDRSIDVGGIASQGDEIRLRLWDIGSAALRSKSEPLRKSSAKFDLLDLTSLFAREVKGDVLLKPVVPNPGEAPPAETTNVRTAGAAAGAGNGFSSEEAAKVTVKHHKATRQQLQTIDAILTEAARLGANEAVMAACLMCATQESEMGLPRYKSRGDHVRSDTIGTFQQGPEWISREHVMSDTLATRAFLLGAAAGVGGTDKTKKGWKQAFGSLHSAPGNLGQAIFQVQRGGAGAGAWESEARRAVRMWLGGVAGTVGAAGGGKIIRPGEWRRGTSEGRESSWTALDRYARMLGRRRFVALPTSTQPRLVVAADQQLILARPHLTLDIRDEIIVERPSIDLEGAAHLKQIELSVLASAWSVPPGGVLKLLNAGPADGPWIVETLRGADSSDVVRVALTQPTTTVEASGTSSAGRSAAAGGAGAALNLPSGSAEMSKVQLAYAAAVQISNQGLPYAWGGGHPAAGRPTQSTRPGERQVGYDCSGYVGAILAAAGMGYRIGRPIPGSGEMAARWGRPGRGRHVTVWANANHVYIEFTGLGQYRRADTSPQAGDSNRQPGPRVRSGTRSSAGFTARHWPGT